MTLLLLKLVVAYLLGSLSGSLLLGRRRGIDIRTLGSGNAGGTNAFRTQGWKFGASVAGIDVAKGALAALLGLVLPITSVAWSPGAQAYLCGYAAVLGHVWPVFYGFRGGKGAATLVGVLLVLCPAAILPVLLVWLLVLTASGYVGLATVLAAAALAVFALLVSTRDTPFLVFALAAFALVVYTHRANLTRLFDGKEHRFERARVLGRLFDRAR